MQSCSWVNPLLYPFLLPTMTPPNLDTLPLLTTTSAPFLCAQDPADPVYNLSVQGRKPACFLRVLCALAQGMRYTTACELPNSH